MKLAVLGGSPLARRLARDAILLDRVVQPGPWLSRRVDPDTGEGIRAALLGVDRLVVVLDGPSEHLGLYLVLRPDETRRRVVFVTPPGIGVPAWTSAWPAWSTVSLGYAWGAGDPLFDGFESGVLRAAPNPGPIPVVPMDDACGLVLAALDHPGARWAWNGVPTALSELAPRAVGSVWLASRWARRAGVPWRDLMAWAARPGGPRNTPGWDPGTGQAGSAPAHAALVGDAPGA